MAKRNYPNNGFPSVTDVLGVLRSIALEMWFKNNTPEFIARESAIGREVGTEIHEAIEQYIQTGEAALETKHTEEAQNALSSFALFCKENKHIKLKKAELALTSETYKFNGTIDCIGDPLIIVDWKTGKRKNEERPPVYSNYKDQVSAYVYLYNDNHAKKITEALIIPIAKDAVSYNSYRLTEQEIDFRFHEIFLPALKIYNAQKQRSFADALQS